MSMKYNFHLFVFKILLEIVLLKILVYISYMLQTYFIVKEVCLLST